MRTRQRRRMRTSPHRSHAVRCLRQATTFALAQDGHSKVEEVSVGRADVSTEIRPSAAPRKLCSSTQGSSGSRVFVREGRGETVLVEGIGIFFVLWLPAEVVVASRCCGHHRCRDYHKSITLTQMNASSNLERQTVLTMRNGGATLIAVFLTQQ